MGPVSTEEEWCDYGDTLKVACEHCQTGEKNAGRRLDAAVTHATPLDDGPRFSQFPGKCMAGRNCLKDGNIEPEQWIVRHGEGWAHEGCVD